MPLTNAQTAAAKVVGQLQDWTHAHEEWRGRRTLNLNANGNALSPTARAMLSTRLADKALSGSLGRRHHTGGRFIDLIETTVVDLGKDLFHAAHVEYRPTSGNLANGLTVAALTNPGDTILGLPTGAPGHHSYREEGWAGRLGARIVNLPFDYRELDVIPDEMRRVALETKPKLIAVGTAMLLFPYDLGAVRRVADEVGALVMYDAAHAMGLIAGGEFQDPLRQGADVISGSTQKSFPGPIGGLIMTRSSAVGEQISDLTARLLSNYQNNRVLSLGVAMAEMTAFGNSYIRTCIANAKLLAGALAQRGFEALGAHRGYTMSNQIILDVAKHGTARDLTLAWEAANIIASPMQLPSPDAGGGRPATGVRLGVQEITRLGMGPAEIVEIAEAMRRVADGEDVATVGRIVSELVDTFKTVYYCFENPVPPNQAA